jgi:class 3 adenylate cyclase/tetratricopeptide (TPR) repeat protein
VDRPCANCGSELPAAAKFCPECAHPTGWGSEIPAARRFASPDRYTPPHLTERILGLKAALEGERKQVTVLFADLKGSMELIARGDPEEASRLLDPVLERMMAAVHHYEGTVNQVMGDGIMALFGAPLALEDHAVRACYAALRMQDLVRRYAEDARRARGVNVQIRVGLNSGEVVVRTIGSDLRTDYTAVGRTTHLAARMEQLASPGAILLTRATLDLAEGYIAVTPLGPVPVKGLDDAVEVYELTGAGPARTRFQAAARRGLSRFVGRDAELAQLHRLQDLARDGQGQIAAVVGEAGVGKSRVVYEFTRAHRQQGWVILDAASIPYGRATSYLPVIDLVKRYFGIEDGDGPRSMREKATQKLLALDAELAATLPAFLALLGLPADDAAWQVLGPAERRERTRDAVRRVLLREARERPLLVVLEDLHWMDDESRAVLDSLVDALDGARLLLLVSYRREYQPAWAGEARCTEFPLDVLPAESATALLDALLGEDPGLAPLKQLLVSRGNPFFLEETVRTLVETAVLTGEHNRYRLARPVQAIQVPPTVQAMLAARIDRLAPEDKRLLQVAAVVGKEVPFALLQAIAELPEEALRRGLDRLQAAEFLYEARLYPDLEYSFKHALTHEVAYGGLLQERRRELHARIVAALEALHRDRLDEQTEWLAHHAARGELREKAVHYLRQAGLRAVGRSALADARARFEQALAILASLPEGRATLEQAFALRMELRPVLNLLGEVRATLDCLRAAETLAERLSDDPRRGRVWAFITNIHTLLGEPDEALATGTRAVGIAERLGDLRLRILATTFLEQAHYFRGDYAQAAELAAGNLAVLPAEWADEDLGNVAPASVYDRVWLVLGLAQLGRFGAAAAHEAAAIRLAAATPRAFTIGMAHLAASTAGLLAGDWARARSLAEHWLATVRRGNVALLLTRAVAASARVLAQLGEARPAAELLREGVELVEREAARGLVGLSAWSCEPLGRAALLLGRLDEARSLGERAVESARSQPGFAAYAQHLLGEVATGPGRFDAALGEAHYRQALALAESRGMRPLVAHCRLGLGKLYRRAGRRAEALEQLASAQTMYGEMDMRFWLGQASEALAA